MNQTNIMDLQGGIHTVDALAGKSDRWLMIALVFTIIIVGGIALRYFVQQVALVQDKADKNLAAVQAKADSNSAAFQSSLLAIVQSNTAAMDGVKAGLEANTKATQEHTETIRAMNMTCQSNWRDSMRRSVAAVVMFAFLLFASGCSYVRICDDQGRTLARASMPAWPWQDSTRAIERLNISKKGTNFTVSLKGLEDAEKTSTNLVFFEGVGVAIGKALHEMK